MDWQDQNIIEISDEGKKLLIKSSRLGMISLRIEEDGSLNLYATCGGVDFSVERANILQKALQDYIKEGRFSELCILRN